MGEPIEEDLWVHLWTFNDDGKITTFRHIGDLAREEVPFKRLISPGPLAA